MKNKEARRREEGENYGMANLMVFFLVLLLPPPLPLCRQEKGKRKGTISKTFFARRGCSTAHLVPPSMQLITSRQRLSDLLLREGERRGGEVDQRY